MTCFWKSRSSIPRQLPGGRGATVWRRTHPTVSSVVSTPSCSSEPWSGRPHCCWIWWADRPDRSSKPSRRRICRRRQPIAVRRARIETLLGFAPDDRQVEGILTRLGMQVDASADGWLATPPSYRFDLAMEADLIEEVGRVYRLRSAAEHPLPRRTDHAAGHRSVHAAGAGAGIAGRSRLSGSDDLQLRRWRFVAPAGPGPGVRWHWLTPFPRKCASCAPPCGPAW